LIGNNIIQRNPLVSKRVPSILLVDDDSEMLFVTRKLIATHGHVDIRDAQSPPDAFRLLRDMNFDLVFCDYFMSGGSGHEVFSFLQKQRLRSTAFILFTSAGKSIPLNLLSQMCAIDKCDSQGLISKIRQLGLL